jgi:anti-sigma regulatory factor (Ser/Thr protein kinase)
MRMSIDSSSRVNRTSEMDNGIGPWGGRSIVDIRLTRDVRAPGLARRALEALRFRIDGSTLDNLKLLVSELVTNSVQHAGALSHSWVRLRLRILPDVIRAEITDPGLGFIREPRPASRDQESGRGLYLVDLISDRWGVEGDGITRVWFEIGAAA